MNEHYAKLKTTVMKKIFPSGSPVEQNSSLERIKDFFRESINSNRSMSKVKSLQCIFQLLEDCCLLSVSNVSPLSYLGSYLNIPEINEVVDLYIDLHWNNNDAYCKCICGMNCDYQQYLNNWSDQENHSSDLNNNNDANDELDEAISNLAVRIGNLWPFLSRQLNVKERHIEEIQQKYPVENQPKEALLFWRRSSGSNATMETLDSALNERLSKRLGLGTHMKEPVYNV